jgi:hypothetical protein
MFEFQFVRIYSVLVHHLRHPFAVELAEIVEVIRFFHGIPLFTNNSLLIQLWFSE